MGGGASNHHEARLQEQRRIDEQMRRSAMPDFAANYNTTPLPNLANTPAPTIQQSTITMQPSMQGTVAVVAATKISQPVVAQPVVAHATVVQPDITLQLQQSGPGNSSIPLYPSTIIPPATVPATIVPAVAANPSQSADVGAYPAAGPAVANPVAFS
mmetsp:Transcript_4976/g.8149  ORF Transcript_4976/g.8149 Transcript_4976/m.8149 type:complete len:157 (+) Transcript_4976:62-532(+)